jgi:hypothetical protein
MDLAATRGSFAVVVCSVFGYVIPGLLGVLKSGAQADFGDGKREQDDETGAVVG